MRNSDARYSSLCLEGRGGVGGSLVALGSHILADDGFRIPAEKK